MKELDIIITLTAKKNADEVISKILALLKTECRVFVIDTSFEICSELAKPLNLSYLNCTDEQQKIAAFNAIMAKSADADSNMLLIDESLLPFLNFDDALYEEMRDVLYYTEKHAFASPRIKKSIKPECYHEKLKLLPRFTISIEPDVGFVYIKGRILHLINALDDSYNSFDYAFMDFVQKANMLGFSSVKCNHVLVSTGAEARASTSESFKKNDDDKRLFLERYPYYNKVKKVSEKSEENPIDKFSTLLINANAKKRILFNCRGIPAGYDGTVEYTLAVIGSIYNLFKDKYDMFILTTQEADDFHHFSKKYPNILFPDTITGVFDLGFCGNQLYHLSDLMLMNEHCLKSIYVSLDIIALRSYYLSYMLPNAKEYMKYGTQLCDGIITISDYSKNDIKAFFIDSDELQNKPIKRIYITSNASNIDKKKYSLPFDDYFLIVGNRYKHKALSETIAAVANTNSDYIIIGGTESGLIRDNIYNYPSGQLEKDFINYLYSSCKALIFPSVYEGFGLPISTMLKLNKPVVLYNNSLNNELLAHYGDFNDYFRFFDRFSQLNGIIDSLDFAGMTESVGYKYTWDDVAVETEAFFQEILGLDIDFVKRAKIYNLINFISRQMIPLDDKNKELAKALETKSRELEYLKSKRYYRITTAAKGRLRNCLPGLYSLLKKCISK